MTMEGDPIEVDAEVISETTSGAEGVRVTSGPPQKSNVGGILRGAATLLDAASGIPDKLGKGDVAVKMKIGAAAARALSEDADATIAAGKALVEKSKTMVTEGKALLSKMPPIKNNDRSHLTRTRKGA
jgi:hypothetical protein